MKAWILRIVDQNPGQQYKDIAKNLFLTHPDKKLTMSNAQ